MLLGVFESSLYTFICLIAHFWLNDGTIKYFVLLNKFLYVIYILWFTTLFYYVINLNKVKSKELVCNILAIVDFVLIGLISYLDVEIFYDAVTGLSNSSGPSSDVLFVGVGLYVLATTICTILNYRRSVDKNKYIPFFVLLITMVITLVIRYVDPLFSIYTNVLSFVLLVMYFTIENPDVKMVDELIRNRRIIERSSEEKSIFLFKISQELKEPVKNISEGVKEFKNKKLTEKEVDTVIEKINCNNNKIKYLITNVVGITVNDSRNLKTVEKIYNIYSLINEIEIRTRKVLKKGLDLKFTCDSNIPTELYGDSIKIKQVLFSIIINSLENTNCGYVHIDITSITKYDICRLVISIKDSGKGMDLMMINDILDSDKDISDEEYAKLDKLDVDLKIVFKIVKSLNGTMYIKSEINKGTDVIVTLDQYIKETKETKREKVIESYIRNRTKSRKALIVNNDEVELKKIRRKLEMLGYEVYSSIFAFDSIMRIKNQEEFDLILIDDEKSTMNSLLLLNELKKMGNDSKKIVLLETSKSFIGHHYVKEGFDNFIDKNKLWEEIEIKCK